MFGLVCSGGGAVGAYQVGALKFIHENFCVDGASPFKIFTGVSCGSLNAAFMSAHSYNAIEEIKYLEDLWMKFHIPEYHGDLGKKLAGALLTRIKNSGNKNRPLGALLDPTPMIDVINKGFPQEGLEECYRRKTTMGLGIAATEMVSSLPVWFLDGPNAVDWDRFHSIGMKAPISTEHVAASCSIPVFMPPVKLDEHYYLDGGVNLGRPLSAAIAMGSTKILCIRTSVSMKHNLPKYSKKFRPTLGTLAKFLLNSIAKDATFAEIEQIEVLNRVYDQVKPLLEKAPPSSAQNEVFEKGFNVANYKPISTFSLSPSKEPSDLYKEFKSMQHKPSKRSSHEFTFHKDYISILIKLGYEDAMQKKDELKEFFNTP